MLLQKNDVISFNYAQPVDNGAKRFGKVLSVRDTRRQPVMPSTYRSCDEYFDRSQLLVNLEHPCGARKAYYLERSEKMMRYPSVIGRVMFGVVKLVRKFI